MNNFVLLTQKTSWSTKITNSIIMVGHSSLTGQPLITRYKRFSSTILAVFDWKSYVPFFVLHLPNANNFERLICLFYDCIVTAIARMGTLA